MAREAMLMYQKVLLRNRIIKIIDETSAAEAVCMIAPYGYGKTAAALSWIKARSKRAAWITLDETDDAEAAFINTIYAALLPFSPEDDAHFYTQAKSTQDVKAFLRGAASRFVKGSMLLDTLVIDDFHFINDYRLLCCVKEFIKSLLGYVSVFIISRSELPPVFNDLILKRNVCLITIKELGFDIDEMEEYFSVNGHLISRAAVERIYAETEGWPAAMNAILAISREDTPEYDETARAYIKAFFETEIWDRLDEGTRGFLLKTSVLDKLTPAACHAMTGIGATLPILNRLFTNGLFMSRVGRDTYRYHRVFKDYLLYKLANSAIDERDLYEKSGWWHLDKGHYEESFRCFFKSRELYGISQALRILNPADMGIERYLELISCVTELDIVSLKPYPIIVAIIAFIYFLTGEMDKMRSLYPVFMQWSEPGELSITPQDYEEFLFEQGWLVYLDPDEPTNANPKHNDWINNLSKVNGMQKLLIDRTSVLYFPTMLRGVRDYGDESIFYVEPILKRVEAGEKGYIDLQESVYLTNILLAEYYYELERFAEAEQLLRRVMAPVEEKRLTFIYIICTAVLIKIIRATHDPKEIDSITARLKEIIISNNDTFLLPNFHALEMRNRLASGVPGFTEEFKSENKDYEKKPYFFLIYRHFTFVRGLISTGEYNRALVLLGNLELLCKKYKRPTDLVEVNVLRSISLYRLGEENKASELLREAMDKVKKYGFIRIFSDDAKDIWPILTNIRKKDIDEFAKNVMISCKKSLARDGLTTLEGPDELTKTELKILKSLQMGMSYEEIALENGIKLSTVKSHAHSIYTKLRVNNRTSAVISAQKAGILA